MAQTLSRTIARCTSQCGVAVPPVVIALDWFLGWSPGCHSGLGCVIFVIFHAVNSFFDDHFGHMCGFLSGVLDTIFSHIAHFGILIQNFMCNLGKTLQNVRVAVKTPPKWAARILSLHLCGQILLCWSSHWRCQSRFLPS